MDGKRAEPQAVCSLLRSSLFSPLILHTRLENSFKEQNRKEEEKNMTTERARRLSQLITPGFKAGFGLLTLCLTL